MTALTDGAGEGKTRSSFAFRLKRPPHFSFRGSTDVLFYLVQYLPCVPVCLVRLRCSDSLLQCYLDAYRMRSAAAAFYPCVPRLPVCLA